VTFSLVGPGKVGASLASWAVARGAEAIALGVREEREATRDLAGRLDCVMVPAERLKTEGQDLLLICVPDPALEEVARTLGRRRQAAVALHTSGSRDASVLEPVSQGGTAVGSLHPLKAFPHPLADLSAAAQVLFGIDGDEPALRMARRLAAAWDARTVEIPMQSRLLYHFAATLAAGGVVTLLSVAAEIADRAGLPREVLSGYFELARGALAQGEAQEDPAEAITGPVARGDRKTVLAEMEEIAHIAPEMLPTILVLARESLRQRRRIGAATAETDPLVETLEERLEEALDRWASSAPSGHGLS
jgi:predicted short-subunit dehydrogenase-like oxidoreductase (DUF2520 family)